MKKTLSILAALMLLASTGMAQMTRNDARMAREKGFVPMQKHMFNTLKSHGLKAVGDTITNFPWDEGFENNGLGWTFVNGNATGNHWGFVVNPDGQYQYSHSGSNCLFGTYSDSVNTNQWAISPVLVLPNNVQNLQFSYYVRTTSWEGVPSHYQIRLSTGSADTANFTVVLKDVVDSANAYVKCVVDLSSYAGQTVRIAIRNITARAGDAITFDDLHVGAPMPPMVNLSGSAIALLNQPATFTATCDTNIAMVWTIDNVAQSETGTTLTYTFTTAGNHMVKVSATTAAGTGSDSMQVNAVDCGNAISTFPYHENFESPNPCWMVVSADASNDNKLGVAVNDQPFQGTSVFGFSSYNQASNFNQYLISPELSLPTTGQQVLRFWYRGYTASESFRVRVSTTTSDTAAMTTLLEDVPTTATTWTEKAYTLPANTKYIAINYYGDYQYYLYIDSLSISSMTAPTVVLNGPASVGTGNEATFEATTNLADSTVWKVDGVLAAATGNTLQHTFTTAGMHKVLFEAWNSVGVTKDSLMVDVFSCDNITLPYAPDFTEGLGCWVNRSDSTSGYGWMISSQAMQNPIGQLVSMSASQSFFGVMDVPVDNWVTSPVITMPAQSANYEVAWKVMAGAASYASDHYGVYLIQGSNQTLLFEETLTSSVNTLTQRIATLPSDLSGDFRIAFRHFNSQGGYAIILDDIQVRPLSGAIVSLQGPDTAMSNVALTFNAISSNADSYAWTVDGASQSETGNSLTYTFTTAGDHTVIVTATNNIGSSSDTLNVNIYSCDAVAAPWVDGFEGDTKCWILTTYDGANRDILIYTDNGNNIYANNGTHSLIGPYSDDVDVDQWAITPAIAMPEDASGYLLSYHVLMTSYEGIKTRYQVLVSTEGTDTSDFTVLKEESDSTGRYVQRTISLEDYAGQTIRIAFRNITARGGDMMAIDDIEISNTVGIRDVESNSSMRLSPNPASDMVTISTEGIEGNVRVAIVDLNGRTVMQQQGNAQSFTFDVRSLARGAYFVQLSGENTNAVRKLIVK